MADTKVSALPAASGVTADDLIPIVNDPSGTPATQKATAAQLASYVLGGTVTVTAAGRALLDDADAAAQRTTLGLGTAATAAIGDFASAEGHILIVDSKAADTNGGDFTSGAWRTRDLNTEVFDTGNHASVATNQITLAAGTYRCRIIAPAYGTIARHRARLQDITNTATLAESQSAFVNVAVQSNAEIIGRFTLAGSTVVEVQHRSEGTQASGFGFGIAAGGAFTVSAEIYTIAEFWRE